MRCFKIVDSMVKDFCLMYQVWLKSFDSVRCKKAKVIFNIYKGGSKKEKEQPGHTPGLLDNCPRIPPPCYALTPERNCGSAGQTLLPKKKKRKRRKRKDA